MGSFHRQAISSSNQNILMTEKLQQKVNDMEVLKQKREDEIEQILEKNRELVQICKDWETKYKSRLDEINFER